MKREKDECDEFYTMYQTVKEGIEPFASALQGKIVYCPCDDYRKSNFVRYLADHFEDLGLQRLIATAYNANGRGLKYIKNNEESEYVKALNGNGDFASEECKKLMARTDVILTNPPFSKKEQFINQVMGMHKRLLILCPQTTFTIKSIARYVTRKELWFSHVILNGGVTFEIPNSYELTAKQGREIDGKRYISISAIKWITNIDFQARYQNFTTSRQYRREDYEVFDNYQAININTVKDVPDDYYGVMGVPVTYLPFCNPKVYRFLGARIGNDGKDLRINGKAKFTRFLVQRQHNDKEYPVCPL